MFFIFRQPDTCWAVFDPEMIFNVNAILKDSNISSVDELSVVSKLQGRINDFIRQPLTGPRKELTSGMAGLKILPAWPWE